MFFLRVQNYLNNSNNSNSFVIFAPILESTLMKDSFETIKNRFGIVGNDPALEHAIDIAMEVAKTKMSVLITGESGVGKENFPKIIHSYSKRKNGPYIAVNCGAIPEGTIDSELFGHKKGAFTGAVDDRKGYFEAANGGTIFLDEVADLPLATQIRLLRVLETGEFIRVGDSKSEKTDVRVVAATNVDITERIRKGKFREDLYFRLCGVPIHLPALRERPNDIYPLFLKFAGDFSESYQMPSLSLTADGIEELKKYSWPGNIRQLKNVTERICLLETNREINAESLKPYLTAPAGSNLPVLLHSDSEENDQLTNGFLLTIISQMSKEIKDLQKVVAQLVQNGQMGSHAHFTSNAEGVVSDISIAKSKILRNDIKAPSYDESEIIEDQEYAEADEPDLTPSYGSGTAKDAERINIEQTLKRCAGNRKQAAVELGISERTLYRKIKQFGLE